MSSLKALFFVAMFGVSQGALAIDYSGGRVVSLEVESPGPVLALKDGNRKTKIRYTLQIDDPLSPDWSRIHSSSDINSAMRELGCGIQIANSRIKRVHYAYGVENPRPVPSRIEGQVDCP